MSAKRDLILELIPILSLRPTQITVGMHEVAEKRKRWRDLSHKKKAKVLGDHMIPVVKGSDKTLLRDRSPPPCARAARRRRQGGARSRSSPTSRWSTGNRSGLSWTTTVGSIPTTRTASGCTFRRSRNACPGSRTTRTAASPASCGAPAATPRTPRRSANSFGPTSCAGAFGKNHQARLRQGDGAGARIRQEPPGDLSARLVRPGGRLAHARPHAFGMRPSM